MNGRRSKRRACGPIATCSAAQRNDAMGHIQARTSASSFDDLDGMQSWRDRQAPCAGDQLWRVKYRIHNLRSLSKDLADFVTFSAAL